MFFPPHPLQLVKNRVVFLYYNYYAVLWIMQLVLRFSPQQNLSSKIFEREILYNLIEPSKIYRKKFVGRSLWTKINWFRINFKNL